METTQNQKNKEYQFPKSFMWGTAMSAYQTEGNNTNTDWWGWGIDLLKKGKETPQNINSKATIPHKYETSGIACDFYNRYGEDLELAKNLNNNAIRLSVEWARIEPQEDVYDLEEINHYKKVLQTARQKGLKVFLTLHHFSSPLWFAKKGGFENSNSPRYFARYAKKCAEEFEDLIEAFLTINEPQIYTYSSYLTGKWPPQKKNILTFLSVQKNLINAHNEAYKEIKKMTYKPAGIVQNIAWYEADSKSKNPLDKLVAKILHFLNCELFLFFVLKNTDLIGLNYYFTNRIRNFKIKNPNDRVTDTGWWINPEGLKEVLIDLKKFNKPLYITENGIADGEDVKRREFIYEMLKACKEAIDEGVDLRGYFYWSLLDNYEWGRGYWPKFGLIEVDRQNNLKRIPRPSYYYYAEICKDGILEPIT